MRVSRHDPEGVAPFGDPRINAGMTAPPGLSQPSHVLRRPLAPRHPPCALCSLTYIKASMKSQFFYTRYAVVNVPTPRVSPRGGSRVVRAPERGRTEEDPPA